MTTLRRALEHSFNSSAVKLQQLVGGEAVVETARRFGITTPLHPYPSMALGSLEARLIDLVRAYAGFANLGEGRPRISSARCGTPTSGSRTACSPAPSGSCRRRPPTCWSTSSGA